MISTDVHLPLMTNEQYDYVSRQAHIRHIDLNICPTCRSSKVQLDSGAWEWPKESTYRLYGEDHPCDCQSQIDLLRYYLLADIPKGYWRLDEGDYWSDDKALASVEEYIDHWDDYKAYGFGYSIYSPHQGVGKTFLASLTAKRLVKRGEDVKFVYFNDTIGLHNLKEDDRAVISDRIKYSTVLILDEVRSGLSASQRHMMSLALEDLLRFRTNSDSITIITTNMTKDELESEYPRSFSLLNSKQLWIEMRGEDARMNGDKRMLDIELMKNHEMRPIV